MVKGTPPLSVPPVGRGGTGDMPYLLWNLPQLLNLTGYHVPSFALGNLVDQIGLLGHLPSCFGIGCTGAGGIGALIFKATPIGLPCHDWGTTSSTSATVVSIAIARAIGFNP